MLGWLKRVVRSVRPIRPGDVVIDRRDDKRVTVERIEGDRAAVVWFEGATSRRGSLLTRHLKLAA